MHEHTIMLLKECSSGCKMGIESMNQVSGYVKDPQLEKVIAIYNDKHRELELEVNELLAKYHKEEKEPQKMASAFSKISTEMKLMMENDSRQIAKILMNGCNMGVQSICEYLNKYTEASDESRKLAKRLESCEEKFAEDLKPFL